jgi:HD-GYP domain-containing protein (c-di-GMP phosphodiesterase class II)
MLKSKNIEDYFQAKLSDIKPGVTITFDMYLFFQQNRHLMLWRTKADPITDNFIDKYKSRGLQTVWIHKDDTEEYYRYLRPDFAAPKKPKLEKVPEPEPQPEAKIEQPPPEPKKEIETKAKEPEQVIEIEPKTEMGAKIVAIMNMENVEEAKKATLISMEAKVLLNQTASAMKMEDHVAAQQQAKKVIQDVISNTANELSASVNEMWHLSESAPEINHATNVATYVVIFALAFGRIDQSLIADLAFAALVHDIGLSQIPFENIKTPWKRMTDDQLRMYAQHVKFTVDYISMFAPEVPQRVKAIIYQHHEKFDGSGYPQGLKGFKVDDVAQLLSIADVMESVSSGRWDGVQRTLKDTFALLESLEKVRSFPEYFNPEVFEAIMRWSRSVDAEKHTTVEAMKTVKEQTKHLMRDKKAG